VKVANTFIHIDFEDPDAAVARRSASCPPKLIKKISFSMQQQQQQQQQQKVAFRPAANQGAVASAEHVGQQQQQQHQQQKLQAHQRGQCRPCSFQSARADSCRLGDDCQFCHLCTYEDFMQKKNAGKHDRRKRLRGEKRLLLKAQCSEQQGGQSSSPEAAESPC
ncbi:unnamed protein product, partial [Polarella glacialis]